MCLQRLSTTGKGIIEADETYIGGKPRKPNKREDDEPSKRGRGTEKTAIIGAIQRGGKVVAQVAEQLTGRSILKFIRSVANLKESELITDEYQAYKLIGKEMKHTVINHNERFTDGDTHINTIEGFWSLLKRAWFGSHHHYETGYTPLYVAEVCYKYNYRNRDIFSKFINESMLVHWRKMERLEKTEKSKSKTTNCDYFYRLIRRTTT